MLNSVLLEFELMRELRQHALIVDDFQVANVRLELRFRGGRLLHRRRANCGDNRFKRAEAARAAEADRAQTLRDHLLMKLMSN